MIDFMRKHKFVAIMRNIDPSFAEKTARALYDGGVRLFEVTFNPSDADTVKKTGSVIEKLNEMFDGTALVGAGTVLTLAVYGDGRDKRRQHIGIYEVKSRCRGCRCKPCHKRYGKGRQMGRNMPKRKTPHRKNQEFLNIFLYSDGESP